MSDVNLTVTNNGVSLALTALIDRGRSMQSFLNRNIYRIYQNAQRTRWMTENESEGGRWKGLNAKYERYKRKRFASYEGAGTKMLIATNRLYKSVIGPGNGQRKIVTNSSMVISTNVGYAKYVDDARSFSTWGPEFRAKIKQSIGDFIMYNIQRGE